VLPEAASIVFGGGFPRSAEPRWVEAAQRAIYYVQREMERAALADPTAAVVLCDRGTLDGAAYWPGDAAAWAISLGTTLEAERARYSAVIELRTPPPDEYNHRNPVRIESAAEAARSDDRIDHLWADHARHHVIPSTRRFIDKVQLALDAIEAELPDGCRA
jgi:hypothetical protein